MATRHLPILSNSAPAPILTADPAAARWRWSADAKLLPSAGGRYVIRNFANGSLTELEAAEGKLLSQISGLAFAFQLPTGVPPALLDKLTKRKVLIAPADLTAYEDGIRASIGRALERSHGLIIMPTGRCNFRCTYCYETFEQGRMSEASADALSKAIDRIAGAQERFSLGFFGGEPLMCPDLVLRFSRQAFRRLADRGMPYTAGVTTNAHYLTPELFEQLLDAGVSSYQITIDGDRELHDRQRVTVKGGPTFDRIVGHLRHMAASKDDFHCIVRCNSRREDRVRVMSLFEGDELRFLRGDSRFVVDLHTIWASDGKEVTDVSDDAACGSGAARPLDIYFYNRELEAHGLRTTAYRNTTAPLSIACYAGKPNWFVVGPDLTLYKCTVAFDREDNRVGKVLADGSFAIDEAKHELWTGSNAQTDTSCGTCHLRVPCSGIACPLTRFTEGHKACPDPKSIDRLRAWAMHRPTPS
ncbi:MAG TPA: radical SAM protein [Kofleriaceae bacterium]|nr:radical SAM protein [Kofleriaceae bacterium]